MEEAVENADTTPPFLKYRGRIELHDFLAYMRIVERLQILLATRRVVWALSLLLLALSITALTLGRSWEGYLLLAFAGYYVTWPIHHPLYLRWQYGRARPLMPDTDLMADGHGVQAISTLADVRYSWDAFKLAVDSPDGVLLCNELRQALVWFPQRAFSAGGRKADVLTTAARHGVKVIRFGGG